MRWIAISLLLINAALAAGYLYLAPPAPQPEASGGALPTLEFGNLRSDRGDGLVDVPTLTTLNGSGDSSAPQCAFVGSFGDSDRAVAAQRRLAALEIEAAVTAVEVPDEPLWWVHLPPADTAAEAERRLRQLNDQQVESFLVSQGEFQHAISLGYFRSRNNAVTLRDRLQDDDVDARVREIQRYRDSYWLVVQPDGAGLLGERSLASIRDSQPDIELREASCDWLQNT
ncbi:SPOR domain-containing protein [Natronospirillum operosum]|uniref:SPOR domain-containing protein n=1 Tax=Natronospirillum operosum TaxID=2759953 RepID=A0A4Z0W4C5_9GAMM|nr:SPOR domain-containing protein [Natronospirillum operosum]TGG90153.1 SPOR domain-containing protein [Natronospirillum operosum]